MSYYSQWLNQIEDSSNPADNQAFVERYYQLEKEAYDRILTAAQDTISGTAADLARSLGFGDDMIIFAGFLDGIHSCLREDIELDTMTDETELTLVIDFEKVYWKMHEVKADWLYSLDSWDRVLSSARREELARAWRQSKIVHHEKIGRNDPCPCGSGRKYKACCGKNL